MRKTLVLAVFLLGVSALASGQCLLTYQTEAIPLFHVGQPANFQLEGVSGTEPYRFEIYDGALPEGMHLTPSGRIVGVPKMPQDTTVFIRLTDAAGCTLVQAFPATVEPAP